MKKRILIVENNPVFLKARKTLLEADGYEVLTAEKPEEAKQILTRTWVHLVVVDKRLVDDADEHDLSGIKLVKETDPVIPKIILTQYPEWEDTRDAFKYGVVDYVHTKAGPKALLQAIQSAFEQHVQVNFDLSVEFGGTTFIGMASLIKNSPEGDEELLAWAPELGDLFRKLFYDCREISVFPLYKGHRDTVIIQVMRAKEGGELTPVVVKCGRRDVIRHEAANYDNFVQNFTGTWCTRKDNFQETLRFAGIVYAITAASLERVKRLTDFYRSAKVAEICRVLEQLFQETCKAWYDHGVQPSSERLDISYLKQLSLEDSHKQKELNKWVHTICENAGSLGLQAIKPDGRDIAFHLSPTFVLRYPDPSLYAYRGGTTFPERVLWCITHGDLNGNNILVDQDKRVCWLIDFERTGWGPVLRDFAELEAVLRWELVSCKKMEVLYQFEKILLAPAGFTDEITLLEREVPDDLRKAGQVLAKLRQLAGPIVGADMRQYYMGLLFYAIRMIISGGITSPGQLRPSLMRRAHALLSAAMICYRLEHWDKWEGWPDERAEMYTG